MEKFTVITIKDSDNKWRVLIYVGEDEELYRSMLCHSNYDATSFVHETYVELMKGQQ